MSVEIPKGFWQTVFDRFTSTDERIEEVRRLLSASTEDLKNSIKELKDEIRKISLPLPAIEMIRTFTIEPEALNNFLEAVRQIDEEVRLSTIFPHIQFGVAVAAGTTKRIPLALPFNYVCSKKVALIIKSTYYSTEIKVNIYVDGKITAGCPLELLCDIIFDFKDAYIKEREVLIEIINTSVTNFIATIIVEPSLMTVDFYNKFFGKLLMIQMEDIKKILEK